MKGIPTMKDIADELEVTVMSVSKALSGKEGVSKDLRAKIIAKAEELGYKKAALQKEDIISKNIGILVAERKLNANASFMSIQQALISQLSQIDCYGLTEIIPEESEHLLLEPKLIKENKIDGFIILGEMEPAYLAKLKSAELPYVLMTFDFDDDTDASIVCDNIYCGYTLTQFLFDKGYKKIGFVGTPLFDSFVMDRYLGYHKALLLNSARIHEEYIIKDVNEYGDEQGLFLPEDMPDAFICNDCRVAYKLIHQLEGMEYDIPFDIAVAAFDAGIYADVGIPKLTTFTVDYSDMARLAAESIVVKLQNPAIKLGKKILLGKVIERESVLKKG
mgnify:CR=1 FL=1